MIATSLGSALAISAAGCSPSQAQQWDGNLNGAQSAQQPGATAPPTLVTVHGEVRDSATGQPLPRSLVRIEGEADTGTLTDGDGRF